MLKNMIQVVYASYHGITDFRGSKSLELGMGKKEEEREERRRKAEKGNRREGKRKEEKLHKREDIWTRS